MKWEQKKNQEKKQFASPTASLASLATQPPAGLRLAGGVGFAENTCLSKNLNGYLHSTECWGRVSKGFSPHPGLNCGPLDYETSVITTTPRKLRFSLEKKLQFSWFLHFSWNLVWFRSFKNLEQKMGAIFFLKWLKWIEPACFPPWKKFWNQILYYSFC